MHAPTYRNVAIYDGVVTAADDRGQEIGIGGPPQGSPSAKVTASVLGSSRPTPIR